MVKGGVHGKGGCTWQSGACVAKGGVCTKGGGMHGEEGVCGKWAYMHDRRGMCGGGHVWQGACMTGETATAVYGTHPTGMHSCLSNKYTKPFIHS